MNNLLHIGIILLLAPSLKASSSFHSLEKDSTKKEHQNVLFFDLGGNGLLYSAGYERTLLTYKKYKLSGFIGLSYVPTRLIATRNDYNQTWNKNYTYDFLWPLWDNYFSYPIGVHFTYGSRNKIEIGLSNTIIADVYTNDILKAYDIFSVHFLSLGYRCHVSRKIFIKAEGLISFLHTANFMDRNYTYPQVLYKRKMYPWWLGLGIGYSF